MPTSASGSYSLPTLRFQNSKPGTGSASAGHSLFNTLVDMASGIREARIQGGGGGGGAGSISTGQIASFTACVGDVLATAIRVGDGLSISAGTHDVQINITSLESAVITSFTACVRDAAMSGFVAGNGITFSTSGHSLEIKTATLTVGQMLSFTANVGQAAYAGLAAGTAIVLSFNAATNVTEIRASITSGGGISSFTACVGDAVFPNLKAGTNVSYSFNAGTHQTEINVTGSLGAISSLTTSVHEIVTDQTAVRYVDDYGVVADGTSHPLSETYASLTAALVDYPYALALTDEKDYLAVLTALYDAPSGGGGSGSTVRVHLGNRHYYWGANSFVPTRRIWLTGCANMESPAGSKISKTRPGHAVELTGNDSSGSRFENFEVDMGSTSWRAGLIREYNPLTGIMVLGTNDTSSSITTSVTVEVRPLLSLSETITGKFIHTGPKNPYGNPSRSLEITTNPNLFTLGETVSWPSGGSAQVCWTGYRIRCLGITTPVGTTPSVGELITGGTSGATGNLIQYRVNDTECRAVTILSGSVDEDGVGLEDDNYEHFCQKDHFGHGFLIRRRAYLQHVRVVSTPGNGIYIVAGGGGYTGNANLTRVEKVLASNCGGNGVAVAGADANVVTVAECTMTENVGYGVVDASFLGAVVYGNHISGGNIGSFYFSGGNSISFGNYTEGNEDKTPLKPKITRVLTGHLDMCGTTGTPTVVRPGGCRITNSSFESSWLNYDGETNSSVIIRETGGGDGGTYVQDNACLVVQNGGNRGSGIGASIEVGIPLDQATDYGYTKHLAAPAFRIVATESGGTCRGLFKVMGGQGLGSIAVRARAGSSFRGRIRCASAGTITSVDVLATGANVTTLSDTISISNPGAGAGAVLIPVVRRGKIVDVFVQNGGSGYSDTFRLRTAFEARDDYFSIYAYDGNPALLTVTAPSATTADMQLVPLGAGLVKAPGLRLPGTSTIVAGTLTASSDITLTPAGTGRVRFGEFTTTATTMLVTGYIEIRDAGGTIRKLAVVG